MATYTALPDGLHDLVGLEVEVVLRGRLTRDTEEGRLHLTGPKGRGIPLRMPTGGPSVVEVRRAPLLIEAGALYGDEGGALYVGVSDGTVYPYGQPAVTRPPDGALRRVKLVDA